MKRWLPATFPVLFGAALLVLLWLMLARRQPTAVQAVETRAPIREESGASTLTREDAVESAGNQDSVVSVDTTDIVPGGPKEKGARRASFDTVSGPEVAAGLTPGVVMENMRSVIRQYSARFGGNPFGNNREITAQLNGGNNLQVVFLQEEDGMRVNERGELVDNWGSAFFFHQISGTVMEIRSAGADHKMWTRDDLVTK